jgi:hypothetical protein
MAIIWLEKKQKEKAANLKVMTFAYSTSCHLLNAANKSIIISSTLASKVSLVNLLVERRLFT